MRRVFLEKAALFEPRAGDDGPWRSCLRTDAREAAYAFASKRWPGPWEDLAHEGL